jgi:adenosylmethionine-8-amino-7-oxononanoate aminotransferase
LWRSRQRGGHGRACGRRGAIDGRYQNDVDISNMMQTFSNEAWRKLSPQVFERIQDMLEAEREARKGNVAAVIAEPIEGTLGQQRDGQQESGQASFKWTRVWIQCLLK